MNKTIGIVTVVVIIAAALIIGNTLSSQNKEDLRQEVETQKPVSKTVKVKNENFVKTIYTSGRMFAFEKIELFAEVSGILEQSSIEFKEGKKFNKGQVLISIDDAVYRNSLLSQRSNLLNQLTFLLPDLKFDFPNEYKKWDSYLSSFDLYASVNDLPQTRSERERYYIASNNIYKMFYDIKSMEATHAKYTIIAPFDGIVTQSNINPGTLVRNGQKLGEFINTSLFEMEAAIPLSHINYVKPGMKAKFTSYNGTGSLEAKIVRINEAINRETQSVKVYIQSKDRRIKDGMFFNVEIKVDRKESLARIPKEAIKNDKVKIKNNSKEILADVEIIESDENHYYVKGLKDNSEIIIESQAE